MNKQILLVDDEEHMLRLLRFALKPVSAQIHCVSRGAAAVEFLKENPSDLVLLDYSMPDLDGVETLRQIRKLEGGDTIRVIMLTARDQTANEWPQPQVPVAFGLLNLNPAPCMPKT